MVNKQLTTKIFSFISALIICSVPAFADSTLIDLKELSALQKQFTADAGKVRIIALLSPT